MSITTIPTADGKRIRINFEYDPTLVAAVKTIPGAKFDGTTRSWSIAKRYAKHLETLNGVKADADAAYADLVDGYFDAVKSAAAGMMSVRFDKAAHVARVNPIGNVFLGAIGRMSRAKSFKDGRDRFAGYAVPIADATDLGLLVSSLAEAVSDHRRKSEVTKAEAEARRVSDKDALERRHAESLARREHEEADRRGRMGVLLPAAPSVGDVLRRGAEIIRVTGLGKVFRLDDDASSMGWPVGCEGERACYAYYEGATPEEVVALENREAEAKRVAEFRRRQADAVETVRRSEDRPQLGHVPEGETIWTNDRHSVLGWKSSVVLTSDGWLWHVQYDGTDGGSWGEYNLGYNTWGGRVLATPELVGAIRGTSKEI